jgi:hypothetical protein
VYCPKDGYYLKYVPAGAQQAHHGPCTGCGVSYVYDAELGVGIPCMHQEKLEPIVAALKTAGGHHRRIGEEFRPEYTPPIVARVLDMLECEAGEKGIAEYILDSEHSLTVDDAWGQGLWRDRHQRVRYTYTAHWKQYSFPITRDCALQLLAERR